ncbi:MAG: hypothetical protein KDC00_03560 [Flavobacteriales bacterium]|nr:hypothetical protein [Flavobacteriales bacterium]
MRYIIFCCCIPFTGILIAQGYLDNDPRWSVRSICAVPAPCIATDTYVYYTNGDTVIEGTIWTKVVRQGNVQYLWQAPPPVGPGCSGAMDYGPEEHGVYLIRQEGRQLRIWSDNADTLLYDFNLDLGDTLPLSWNNWNDDITVVAVDSVLVGNSMRARFELANSWSQYLIEGVGTSHGLFEYVSDFFDCGFELLCFGLGDVAYYPSTGVACDGILAFDDRKLPSVSIGPIPANERLTLSGTLPLGAIRLLDSTGRVVQRSNSTEPRASIDLSGIPDGTYTVLVDGHQPHRVVVLH